VKDSIGKALSAAQTLTGTARDTVVTMARHAFIVSMRLVYGTASIVVLLAAFVAWRFLPARAASDDDVLFDEDIAHAEALSVTDT
jgi:hypothetical protein